MTHWIDTPEALRARLAQPPAIIGLDTEFIRERTYWPQLALVQIALGDSAEAASDGNILLVDPLLPGMCEALVPLLADPAVLKVMHSASEDLVAFKHACGVLPAPMFEATGESTRAVLFAHRPLSRMDRADRVRACYLHACLKYVNRDFLTNSSVRERFGIEHAADNRLDSIRFHHTGANGFGGCGERATEHGRGGTLVGR